MHIDTRGLRRGDAYRLLTSVIVPRPIAWISTQSAQGLSNLAPFSYFTGVGADPPSVVVSIADKRGGIAKDTLQNILSTRVFCINLVEESAAQAMVATSAEVPSDQSEFESVGLDAEPCESIACVRVKDARVALECTLLDTHRVGRKVTSHLVIGEVVGATLDDAVLADGATPDAPVVDPHRITPVARLGTTYYARLGERFSLARP